MEEDQFMQKILRLIQSGRPINIELAIQLAKGQQISKEPIIAPWRPLFPFAKVKGDSIQSLAQLFQKKYIHYYGSNHPFKEIPKEVQGLPKLESLIIGHLSLNSLPLFITEMPQLSVLEITSSTIEVLPEAIGKLKNLYALNLLNNQIETLPESIGNLKKLHELTLDKNPIKKLPDSFGQLSALHTLYLCSPYLQTLPESFGNLQKLHTLNLSQNQGFQFPKSFKNLHNLRYLKLIGDYKQPSNNSPPKQRQALKEIIEADLPNCRIQFV